MTENANKMKFHTQQFASTLLQQEGYNPNMTILTVWRNCKLYVQARGNYLKVVWATTAGVWKQNSPVWRCVLAQCDPREIFFNLWANLHSEPFPGINDFQKYMQSWTCVWAKFSQYTCMMYDVVHCYSVVIISSIGSPMFTWLSSFWKKPTESVMS